MNFPGTPDRDTLYDPSSLNYTGPWEDTDNGKQWTWSESLKRWEPYLSITSSYAELTDAATADLPALNTPLSDALALKADAADLGTAAAEDVGYFATAAQGTDERVPTAAGLTSKFGTNKATLVDGDKVAILDSAASDAPKHGALTNLWTWALNKIQTTALTFGAQLEAWSSQAATTANSLMTRGLGDTRYGETVFAYKTADTSRSSTTTYSDDPHLAINLTAGTWQITTIQAWQAADATGGMKARMNYTGTWTTADSWLNFLYFITASAVTEAAASTGYLKGSVLANPQTMLVQTQRSGYIRYEGQIKVTTSGVFSIQWAQSASSATATVLPQGCYILAKRVA